MAKSVTGTAFRKLSLGFIIAASAMTTACTPKGVETSSSEETAKPLESRSTVCETGGPLKLPTVDGKPVLTHIAPRADHFCAIVLSIDPTFLGWLVNGDKSFEYRKSHPSDAISHIVFFNNRTMELTAIAEVTETIGGDPREISQMTWDRSGTDVDGLMSYFGDRPVGYATELKNFRSLPRPISLDTARAIDPRFRRPNGYTFLDRHPLIDAEIQAQLKELTQTAPPIVPTAPASLPVF